MSEYKPVIWGWCGVMGVAAMYKHSLIAAVVCGALAVYALAYDLINKRIE